MSSMTGQNMHNGVVIPATNGNNEHTEVKRKKEKKAKKEQKAPKEEKKEKKKQKSRRAEATTRRMGKLTESQREEIGTTERVEDGGGSVSAPRQECKDSKLEKQVQGRAKRKREVEASVDGIMSAIRSEKPAKKQKSGGKDDPYVYVQARSLTSLPQHAIDDFLGSHCITITDGLSTTASRLRPVISFEHLPPTPLLSNNPFRSFDAPTPIQAASWPYTLSRRDVVGVAETGSGKTLAFALPCLYRVLQSSIKGVKAAIVAPTRELAMQTYEQISQLANHVGVSCVCIYGGASKDDQRRLLKKNPDVMVATPGRLRDFMNEGSCDLTSVQFAVLDEADRMLDKGFEDDIKTILGAMTRRGDRQTLMFTATWPRSVQALAATMMIDPVKITIGSVQNSEADGPNSLQANVRISQRVEVMEPTDKETRLLRLVQQEMRKAGNGKLYRIIVFCLYKKEAARVESFLQRKGVKVGGIHGDMNQTHRTAALAAFKSGSVPVLVATDVAARGLDIPEVKLVINCTFPLTIEDYVHRIGRTGRAGKTGSAVTFFTKQDKALSGALVNVLRASDQPVPEDLLKFGTTVKKKLHPIYGAFYREPAAESSDVPAKITFDD